MFRKLKCNYSLIIRTIIYDAHRSLKNIVIISPILKCVFNNEIYICVFLRQ